MALFNGCFPMSYSPAFITSHLEKDCRMLEDAEDESFPSQVCRLHSQIGTGSNPPIICSRKSIELVVGVPWCSYRNSHRFGPGVGD